MLKEIECTSEEFRGLVNPYTGERMKTLMVMLPGGNVRFHAAKTYTTWDVFETISEVLDAWTARNGIRTTYTSGQLKCLYTGERLLVEKSGDGFHLRGGFNPCILWTRAEFLYYATMRDGKSAYPPPPKDVPRVVLAPRGQQPGGHRKGGKKGEDHSGRPDDLSQEAIEQAERIVEPAVKAGLVGGSAPVSMSVGGGKK